MKILSLPRPFALAAVGFFALLATSYADTYRGTVSDDDPADGLLTVTSEVDESTKEFKISAETPIIGADGKPSQLMNLITGTRVEIEAADGPANVAEKITVLPDAAQQVP